MFIRHSVGIAGNALMRAFTDDESSIVLCANARRPRLGKGGASNIAAIQRRRIEFAAFA
jgi:hypothetical protein